MFEKQGVKFMPHSFSILCVGNTVSNQGITQGLEKQEFVFGMVSFMFEQPAFLI